MKIDEQSLVLSNIETIVAMMPGIVFWKDILGHYLGCNYNLAKILNLSSRLDIVGKTVYDILAKNFANEALAIDELVIKNNNEMIVQQNRFINGKFVNCLFKRTPIHNEKNKIIGILGVAFPINDLNNIKHVEDLLSEDMMGIGIRKSEAIPYLTPRQRKCFYYLMQGMSAKQIGAALGLSPRTIESHIEAIKAKFNCYKKSELIQKAITIGYLNANAELIEDHK